MVLASKAQSSITVGLIGPYNWYPTLTFNGSQVTDGYDKINIAHLSDTNYWNHDSWFFWNQAALEIAINHLNDDPNILPNTTIKIKRFKNNDHPMIYARQSPGYAISVAYDIVHSHPDVIAVFGDFMAEDMAADAEVYGYYKIPQCTGNAYTLPLRNRAKYPYYFQTITVTGYAEALGLLLKSWNVKRIAFLAPGTYLGENSLCGYLANSLHNAGFDVISRMVYYDVQSETLDFIASSFERVNARYIFACGSADTLAHMYYGLAKKKRLVGNDYVWIMDNVPYPYNDPIPLWGPHYYKDARGIINLFAGNTMNTFMKEVEYKLQYSAIAMQAGNGKTISLPFMEYWTNMGNMYDCPRIFATGLENLMRSDPTITADMISKRALQEKNFGLFQSTGYRGITGDPVTLTEHGDVAAAFNIFCVDGLSEDMNSPQFALTDPSVTKIMQWKRYQPTFYNGSSIPPPDGPIYTHISIDPNSRSGMMLKVFSASGISLAILFSLVVLIFRNKPAIRSGSVVFLIIMALGTIPSHASHLFYIGIPTAFRCQARLWLQLASYALCLGSILSKNSRVLLIYSAKKQLPAYIVKDFYWICTTFGLFAVEMVLIWIWSIFSKMKVVQTMLPGFSYEYSCVYGSTMGYTIGGVIWTFNLIILLAVYAAGYKSQHLSPVHSEFTLLFILALTLTVSAIMVVVVSRDADTVQSQMNQSILVFVNTCIPVLMQAIPRVATLVRDSDVAGVLTAVARRVSTNERKISFFGGSQSVTMFRNSISGKGRKASTLYPSTVSATNKQDSVSALGTTLGGNSSRKASRVPPPGIKHFAKFTKPFVVAYCFQTSKRVPIVPAQWNVGAISGGIVGGKVFVMLLPHRQDLVSNSRAFPIMWLDKSSLQPSRWCVKMNGNLNHILGPDGGIAVIEFLNDNDSDDADVFERDFDALMAAFSASHV